MITEVIPQIAPTEMSADPHEIPICSRAKATGALVPAKSE